MSTRNYKYGCRAPLTHRDTVIDVMYLANQYRNRLVDIELKRRADTLAAVRQSAPDWAALSDTCDALDSAIVAILDRRRAANAAARGRVEHDDAEQLRQLRDRIKLARADEKALRKPAYAVAAAQCKAISDAAYAAGRDARANCGIYWGSYLLIEQAAESFRAGAPPRYTRFDGDGRVGVQIQAGMTAAELMSGADTRVRLIPLARTAPAHARDGRPLPQPGPKTAAKYRALWLRIASDGRDPVWAVVPIIWHRDLPDGARIKWVVLRREMIGGNERWSVTITIDAPDESLRDPRTATSGACGIDIGYRVMPDGSQRVAVAHGDDESTHWMTLPAGMVDEWAKVRRIRSHRDQLFDALRSRLIEWRDRQTDWPDWLGAPLANLGQWRSSQRLSALVLDWSMRPAVPHEDEILPALVTWRTEREEHLLAYESHLRDQLLARRKNLYREWVAMLRRKYARCYIERMDLREAIHDTMVADVDKDRAPDVSSEQRAAASFVCLSSLRECLQSGGIAVELVDPRNTTIDCHVCGRTTTIDAARQVSYTCEHCGAEWDQDENAARNLLASGEVSRKTRESLASDATQGVSDDAQRKKKVGRAERNAAAREKRSRAAADKRLG